MNRNSVQPLTKQKQEQIRGGQEPTRRELRAAQIEALAKFEEAWDAEEEACARRRSEPSSPMFHFARAFKGWQWFDGLEALEAARRLEIIMERKHVTWEELEDAFECTDARAEFCGAWNEIRFPTDLLTKAAAIAKQRPFLVERSISLKYAYFVSICAARQRLSPDEAFPLAVESFATVLGVNRNTVSIYKKQAIKDGLLTLVEEAIPNERAARFRFTRLIEPSSGEMVSFSQNRA